MTADRFEGTSLSVQHEGKSQSAISILASAFGATTTPGRILRKDEDGAHGIVLEVAFEKDCPVRATFSGKSMRHVVRCVMDSR